MTIIFVNMLIIDNLWNCLSTIIMIWDFLFLLSLTEVRIVIEILFDFLFSKDLHVLGFRDPQKHVYGKYLSFGVTQLWHHCANFFAVYFLTMLGSSFFNMEIFCRWKAISEQFSLLYHQFVNKSFSCKSRLIGDPA